MKISITRNIGFILLAVYLILIGIASVSTVAILPSFLLGVLALAAGICILLGI